MIDIEPVMKLKVKLRVEGSGLFWLCRYVSQTRILF